MGCFEDYMDFREEIDRIKTKDRAKEDPKTDGIRPSWHSLQP
jgi:hypothetical protein